MNTATKNVQRALNLKYEPSAFRCFATANRSAWSMRGHAVMLGCDGRFWVVCLADAERLANAGYEWAN